jgi:hypothetical protein
MDGVNMSKAEDLSTTGRMPRGQVTNQQQPFEKLVDLMKIVLGFLPFPDDSIGLLIGLDEALLKLRVVYNIIQTPSLVP